MTRHPALVRIAALLVLCGSVVVFSPVAAEQSVSEPERLFDLSLEELLALPVTVASPFEETTHNSSSSVSLLQPGDWQRQGARNVAEALEQVPSVTTYETHAGAHAVAIRGYSSELSVRGIATRLDDVPLNTFSYASSAYALPHIALPLLERIEVIRGPGSTLYGSDAFHGVLSMSTWSSQAPELPAQVYAGTGGDIGGVVRVLEELPGDMRVGAGGTVERQGARGRDYRYTDPFSGATLDGSRDHRFRHQSAYAHFFAGDAASAAGEFQLSGYVDNYAGRSFPGIGRQFFASLPEQYDLSSASIGQDRDLSGQDSEFRMIQGGYRRHLGRDHELQLRAYQWRSDQRWVFDMSRHPDTLDDGGTSLACRRTPEESGVSPLYCANLFHQANVDQRRGVNALLRNVAGNTRWALGTGVHWLDTEDSPIEIQFIDGHPVTRFDQPFSDESRRVAHVLFQGRTALANKIWTLAYGARLDRYSDVGSEVSPRLGVIYTPQDSDWVAKLLYSRAVRAPSAAEIFGSGALQLPNPDLEPEVIDSYELVWQWHREGQDSEVVVFHSHWHDGIRLEAAGPSLNQYVNQQRNSAHGVELSHRHFLNDWRLMGLASWVQSENETDGVDYAAFPEYIISAGIGRRIMGSFEVWLSQRLMFERATGDENGLADDQATLDDYWRTDLHLAWHPDSLALRFDVRNLFDRINHNPAIFNAEYGLPEDGISARLTLEFGW